MAAKTIILSKESSESEIKAYFNAVLKLSQSDNEFPINLEEVWPLVYPRKDHAVRSLKENFIEGVDYKTLLKNGEQDCFDFIFQHGGNNKVNYYLTVSCMEFFIARKVRPVFEVYRKVFHGATQSTRNKPIGLKDQLSWVKETKKLLNLNDASVLGMLKEIATPLGLPLPDYTPSKGVLKSATELLKENGVRISTKAFNRKAVESGLLQDVQRNSSNGTVKHFKSITKKGQIYGENQVCPNNPKETQPLWYEANFNNLLSELGLN